VPPASKARILMVRFEPAGSAMVPDATPLTTGMLNTNGVSMSDAVTSTTTVTAAVADTLAVTTRVARPPGGPVPSLAEHEASTIRDVRAAAMELRSLGIMIRVLQLPFDAPLD
jgi:hypothetical protein